MASYIYELYKQFNYRLHFIEKMMAPQRTLNNELPHRPIFIIGPPRSGSTLLYQTLIQAFNIGYLSNLHCYLFGVPALVEKLRPLDSRSLPNSFSSRHGNTPGLTGPSECAEFWYRFFPRSPQYVAPDFGDANFREAFRTAVKAFIQKTAKPVLFKNLHCSQRLQPIHRALPEALFIVIKRNITDNAHSLLEMRKKIKGDYSAWWSVEPYSIDSLRPLPPEKQVVGQINSIYEVIERDKEAIGPEHFLELNYESFTQDVFQTIDTIANFFGKFNIDLELRKNTLPVSFKRRSEVRIDPELYRKLEQTISNQSTD